MTGERPKSFSNIRWFSKLWMLDQLHENWSRLLAFVERLKQGHMAEKTTTKIDAMLQDPVATRELRLGLAATMDVLKPLGLETYNLEGDRLEMLLLYRKITALIVKGNVLEHDPHNRGAMPEVDRAIRNDIKINVGTAVHKLLDNDEFHNGTVTRVTRTQGTVKYTIKYDNNTTEQLWEDDTRRILDVHDHEYRDWVIERLLPVFRYLKDRTSEGSPNSHFDSLKLSKALQLFDPSFVASNPDLNSEDIRTLGADMRILSENTHLIVQLEGEWPTYKALVGTVAFERGDIDAFTKGVLQWWRSHACELPVWSKVARWAFAYTPSAAAAERVFSLLKCMFPPERSSALNDLVEGSLMLRYNGST